MESPSKWSSFQKRILIEKPIEYLYDCWTQKEKIETWFLEKSDFYNANGIAQTHAAQGFKFTWKWNNWDLEEKGEVLLANGKDKVSYTFGAGGNVHISLIQKNTATEVLLIQDNIPTDEQSKMNIFVGCATGWTFWLTNLKAYAEYGITLHAKGLKQEETSNLVNS